MLHIGEADRGPPSTVGFYSVYEYHLYGCHMQPEVKRRDVSGGRWEGGGGGERGGLGLREDIGCFVSTALSCLKGKGVIGELRREHWAFVVVVVYSLVLSRGKDAERCYRRDSERRFGFCCCCCCLQPFLVSSGRAGKGVTGKLHSLCFKGKGAKRCCRSVSEWTLGFVVVVVVVYTPVLS